jgi:acyl-CoA dehydrogenase
MRSSVELAPEYLELQEEARALATTVEPFAAEADAMSTVHPGVRAALADSGLWGVVVPAAFGGRSEQLDPVALCVVREALMGTSAHMDALFALQGVGSYAIGISGSAEQQEAWLPRVLSGEALAAIALTEPQAGSDLKALGTRVAEADGGLVLNGEKAFIANAGAAAFYTVLARDGDGYTFVLLPADAAGLSVTPSPELIAPHVLGDLRFEDVSLPAEARIGGGGQGFELVSATLSVFRAAVGAAAVGLAGAALKEMTRHAATREQFGRPLARLGAVAGMLADSWTELEMARLLTYRAAEAAKEDPVAALPFATMAKLAASEAAGRIVDRGVQIMGRFGLIEGSLMERYYRTARPIRIYEGASETLRVSIARSLVSEIEP